MIYYLRRLHVHQRSFKGPNPQISTLIRRALGFALFAVSIWLIDLRLCEFVNGLSPKSLLKWNPQLHAWWHVLSACALYHATMLVVYYHYDVKEKESGSRPFVDHWLGIFPVIRLSQAKRV
ncbi:hypothetical protein BGX29_011444 [Mortierella sp. GBA35]|nr:hypothetical protein BGX29_011444 [Mortierella sp. GBA35]